MSLWATATQMSVMGTHDQIANAITLVGKFDGTANDSILFYINDTETWWIAKHSGARGFALVNFLQSTGLGHFLQGDWFSVVHRPGLTPNDGVLIRHHAPTTWFFLSSNGSSFTVNSLFASDPFSDLSGPGNIWAPYSDYISGSSGMVFYDKVNEFWGTVFLNDTGGVFFGRWNNWDPTLGHLWGWNPKTPNGH